MGLIVNVFRNGNRDAHEWCIQQQRPDGGAHQVGEATRVVLRYPEFIVDSKLRERFEARPDGNITHAWARGELVSVDGIIGKLSSHVQLTPYRNLPLPSYLGREVPMMYDKRAGKFLPEDIRAEYCIIDGKTFLAYLYPSA